jgi:hypothetical protein
LLSGDRHRQNLAAGQLFICRHVLNYFRRRGWFNDEEVEKMLSYDNSGFSLDASVRIHSWDRSGVIDKKNGLFFLSFVVISSALDHDGIIIDLCKSFSL